MSIRTGPKASSDKAVTDVHRAHHAAHPLLGRNEPWEVAEAARSSGAPEGTAPAPSEQALPDQPAIEIAAAGDVAASDAAYGYAGSSEEEEESGFGATTALLAGGGVLLIGAGVAMGGGSGHSEGNDAPVIRDRAFSLAENSANGIQVTTISSTDSDKDDTRTYAIVGRNDTGAFSIDKTTGGLFVADATKLDYETHASFALSVRVTDAGGLSDTATITVNLSNVAESPAVADQGFTVAENTAAGTTVGTVVATDGDGGVPQSWTILSGNEGGAFAIDAGGRLSVAKSSELDYESRERIVLSVRATDATGGGATGVVTVLLTNVQEFAPAIADQNFKVAEGSPAQTAIGTVVATDGDRKDVLSFQIIGGNDDGIFAIDSATGALTVAIGGVLDFETKPFHLLTVEAKDPAGQTASAKVSVSLIDIKEAPPQAFDSTFSLSEAAELGFVVGQVLAGDANEGDVLNFAVLSGNDDGIFALDAATGKLSVGNRTLLDYEHRAQYVLDVLVTDSSGLFDSAAITVNVTDANDPPVLNDRFISLAENTAKDTAVGTPLLFTDQDLANSHMFFIESGNANGAFAIDGTGQIKVNNPAALDFETTQLFSLNVKVTDSGVPHLSDTAVVTVALTNVNEAPVVENQSFVARLPLDKGETVGVVSFSDDAGDTHVFTITGGNTGNAFALSNDGVLTVAANSGVPQGIYALNVSVVDGGLLSDTAVITVNVF
jgi:hypothetical protein